MATCGARQYRWFRARSHSVGIQCACDLRSYRSRRRPQRIVQQMSIARRGGGFLVAKQGTIRQRHAASGADRSEGGAQMVNAEIAEIGRFADCVPRLFQVYQCRTRLAACNDTPTSARQNSKGALSTTCFITKNVRVV